jgi:hypothetical protein
MIRLELLTEEKKTETEQGLVLIGKQLADVERLVPAKAVAQMKKVTLWLSPPYGKGAGAEYHPGAGWLKQNGRNPAMVKGVEFSGVANLDKEVLRMPLLTARSPTSPTTKSAARIGRARSRRASAPTR